ncbi:hypothetical protein BU23DRAFT_54095 [Bimuria novae-zelandiae CBS 107.79]|uniref:C2H2-type domain-containing protein n=1 Tax=Bimuria novae-zelandiae CBS 107.79 TaxID=1447943 RepID=A0A6A5UNT1_9PLEO|nr:hypothetical protein BU23DRAFT_54095 [Bimuria novae-zelandiae CBS 107.79]
MVLMPVYSYSASMDSQERSGPLSPFQQAPNSAPFLHSPAYPSPAQSDTDSSRYSANGLGLYRYSQPFPTSADRMMFSPSPQPTQAWNASSSMAPAPIVNPWTSGAYDHPVCPDGRANMLWPEYQCSHRSSISSHRELSVFSGDGSEHSFPSVKLEGGAEWDAENDLSPLATVAPSRLTNTISYDGVYGSPKSQYESDSTSAPVGKVELTSDFSPNMRPRSSHSEGNATGTRRRHQRRTKVPVEEAKFKCDICNTGFVRAYNKKTHMARHNPNRAKEHFCDYDCDMKFERRTDLVRHINSVHLKRRDWDCDLCGKKFARRDTLNREGIDTILRATALKKMR